MGTAVVGVIGTLLGIVAGAAAQQVQASRNRRWQQADLLRTAKRDVYAEFLRSISASYAQALSGHRSRAADASLLAAAAAIEVLSGWDVAGPARELADTVLDVHSRIAEGAGVAQAAVAAADERRYEVIDLFKADLGLPPRGPANAAHTASRPAH